MAAGATARTSVHREDGDNIESAERQFPVQYKHPNSQERLCTVKFSLLPSSLQSLQHLGILHQPAKSRDWTLEYPPCDAQHGNAHVFSVKETAGALVGSVAAPSAKNVSEGYTEVVMLWNEATSSYVMEPLASTLSVRYERGKTTLTGRAKALLARREQDVSEAGCPDGKLVEKRPSRIDSAQTAEGDEEEEKEEDEEGQGQGQDPVRDLATSSFGPRPRERSQNPEGSHRPSLECESRSRASTARHQSSSPKLPSTSRSASNSPTNAASSLDAVHTPIHHSSGFEQTDATVQELPSTTDTEPNTDIQPNIPSWGLCLDPDPVESVTLQQRSEPKVPTTTLHTPRAKHINEIGGMDRCKSGGRPSHTSQDDAASPDRQLARQERYSLWDSSETAQSEAGHEAPEDKRGEQVQIQTLMQLSPTPRIGGATAGSTVSMGTPNPVGTLSWKPPPANAQLGVVQHTRVDDDDDDEDDDDDDEDEDDDDEDDDDEDDDDEDDDDEDDDDEDMGEEYDDQADGDLEDFARLLEEELAGE